VVAWALTAAHPERVASLTALSVPHPFAFLTAMFTSVQGLKSWYMYFFQLPWLPERLLKNPVRTLIRSGLSPQQARRDAAAFTGPDSLRTAVNWYRAMSLVNPRTARVPVHRPTLFVWSDGDTAISRQAAQRCARHVQGPYTFVTLAGVNHWFPDQAPNELAELLVPHLQRWPASAGLRAGCDVPSAITPKPSRPTTAAMTASRMIRNIRPPECVTRPSRQQPADPSHRTWANQVAFPKSR